MQHIGRRAFTRAVALLPLGLLPKAANATLFRGLSLPEMTARSSFVLELTRAASECRYETLGDRRLIVTESRVTVQDVLGSQAPSSSELSVLTLGGVVDGVGQLVHGQAEFVPKTRSVAFLTRAPNGALWVTGMAQGHYPLILDSRSAAHLSASPHLSKLLAVERSAAFALVGKTLPEARRLVLGASSK